MEIGSGVDAASISEHDMAARPLSPHLSIYRFAYTMALSILHRATGVLLAFGLVLLVAWLTALASGPGAYAGFAAFAGSWPVRLVLALLLGSFCFHFANGIRHLCWDMGWGLERSQARRSGRLVVIATVLLAAPLIYYGLLRGAGA
jgi:succinate dehydrogenase / fumarate reductase cytochrome b subunit